MQLPKKEKELERMLMFLLFQNLVLQQIIPGLPSQCIANDELEDIERDVGDNAVNPDDSCPSPTNPLDSCKGPGCIYSNDSCHLQWTSIAS